MSSIPPDHQDTSSTSNPTPNNIANVREPPLTPPSPSEEQDLDAKGSRKREREVSLEPATPKTDEPQDDRRTPAPKKKNRVHDSLETTQEEDENVTPPESPNKLPADDLDMSTSPAYETKVKQISRKVKGMKWDDGDKNRTDTPNDTTDILDQQYPTENHLAPAAEIGQSTASPAPDPVSTPTEDQTPRVDKDDSTMNPPPDSADSRLNDSDSDDQEKKLKRKLNDQSSEAPSKRSSIGSELAKRGRDEEEDANPREKKRPTPPPEGREGAQTGDSADSAETQEPAAPQPKVGGFLAYASTSSPFASARGPSVFGQKSTPSPTPLAGTSNGSASSFSSAFGMKPSSPFAIAASSKPGSPSVFSSTTSYAPHNGKSPNALSTSPTGTKRSGFEAFATSQSPFAAASRSKSPPSGLGLARSKSPPRRGAGNAVNAFKAYAGVGTQGFAAPSPPVKKQRQDAGEECAAEDSQKSGGENAPEVRNGNAEGSEEEEADKPTSFADRLRAGSDAVDNRESSEEDEKVVVTEQEVQTGEEEEDTIFQVRGKLYSLSSQNAWKERGTGLLKLNVRKSDGGGARLVMRKEAVYALLLNVTLFKGMRCLLAQDPRYVRFSCIEDGATMHYNLRLSNAKVAAELIEEINANIPSDESDDTV